MQSIKDVIKYFLEGEKLCLDHPELSFLTKKNDFETVKKKIEFVISNFPKKAFLNNPDLFYGIVSYTMNESNSKSSEGILNDLIACSSEPKLLSMFIKKSWSNENYYSNRITSNINKSLKSNFDLDENSLNDYLVNHVKVVGNDFYKNDSVIYSKINHGYWEFLINSFANENDIENKKIRNLNARGYPETWRISGFHNLLFYMYKNLFDPKGVSLGLSTTAGEHSYYQGLKKEQSIVSRGAAMGLKLFIDEVYKTSNVFYDGSVPRDLLKKQVFSEFLNREVNQNPESVLFIVPPHLKNIKLERFDGKQHTFLVPGQNVHEFHFGILPTLIGVLDQLFSVNQKILIFVQAAVLAPIIAIFVDILSKGSGNIRQVRFFDLGRVLDVASPELLEKWPSTSFYLKTRDFVDSSKLLTCNNTKDFKLLSIS